MDYKMLESFVNYIHKNNLTFNLLINSDSFTTQLIDVGIKGFHIDKCYLKILLTNNTELEATVKNVASIDLGSFTNTKDLAAFEQDLNDFFKDRAYEAYIEVNGKNADIEYLRFKFKP